MIPEEVAQIATIIRNYYQYKAGIKEEHEFNYSVQVAWEIYNCIEKGKIDLP